jgi:CDP-diacylglycerol--serine O-phosphatidyltransferase
VRPHLRLANLVTSISLLTGLLALLLVPTSLGVVVGLVLLAAALDTVDGALARRAGGDHTFGAQLDSLSDFLCFCVVPAAALHSVSPDGAPWLGAVAGGAVVVAGAWRLSRFPLVQVHGAFVGLPTPAAGCLLLALVLWAPFAVALLGALALSVLMTSSLRFPSVVTAAAKVRPGNRPQGWRPPRRPARVLARARRKGPGRPFRGRRSPRRRAEQVLGSLRRR